MDETFRMAPCPAFSMCGAASWLRRKTEKTFSSKARRNSVIGMSKGFGPPPPALFTRRVSLPNAATALSTSATRSFSSMTFTERPTARPPATTISAAAASAAFPSRSLTTTAAPAPAKVAAMAFPMPAPAPVTTATSPSSLNAFGS